MTIGLAARRDGGCVARRHNRADAPSQPLAAAPGPYLTGESWHGPASAASIPLPESLSMAARNDGEKELLVWLAWIGAALLIAALALWVLMGFLEGYGGGHGPPSIRAGDTAP